VSPIRRGAERPLHNCLPQLRDERALSRADLAERVEVNVQTIGSLERGDYYPSLDLALRLAEVFERPVEAVFGRAPFPPAAAQPIARTTDRSRT
jgi:DNA-binding XRE family transcriptional regulator